MYTINNMFEIGEECYSVYRKPIQFKCPVCEGLGYFQHNGYDIDCKNCGGSGKQQNPKQFVMDVCKVKVRRIITSLWKDHITIKYKVDCDDYSIRVNNRSEKTLFKTRVEADTYCKAVNTKQIIPEF